MTVVALPRDKKRFLRLLPEEVRRHTLARTVVSRAAGALETPAGPFFTIDIDKELAALFLRHRHERQRQLKSHVEQMARAMDGGDFLCTGDPFRFDTQMRLTDGQHRLAAICQTEADFVLRGAMVGIALHPSAYLYFDIGCSRSQQDIIRAMGANMPPVVAAALQLLRCDFDESKRLNLTKNQKAQVATSSELRDVAVELAAGTKVCAGTLAGALRCYEGTACKEDAFAFFRGAFTGNPEIHGRFEPAAQLVFRFISDRKPGSSSRPSYRRKAAFMSMRAFQDYCLGVQTDTSRFYDYSSKTKMPEVAV